MSEEEEEELELLESELELLALRRETGTCWADSGFSLAAGGGGRERGVSLGPPGRPREPTATAGGRLTFLGRLLGRVQLPADVLQAPLQLPLLLQGQLFLRLAHRLLQGCGGESWSGGAPAKRRGALAAHRPATRGTPGEAPVAPTSTL